jgi:7-cyano-7-deazaguanine reductase
MARRALAYTSAGNSNDSLYNNLQMTENSPLGTTTEYPQRYSPEQLFGIARAENRAALGLATAMPFHGVDIWNAWELTWLASNGLPQVACVEVRVPADSPHIVESKSLKLYLGSFTMTEFASEGAVADALRNDIGACVGTDVEVRLVRPETFSVESIGVLAGDCLDDRGVACDTWQVDAGLLRLDKQVDKPADKQPDDPPIVAETLHSHLLRSLCPVTGQPDCGSVMIEYQGPRIDRDSLLKYIVSYRQHADFHENCVERMFLDILERCKPAELTVYARYQRRGGIDINPIRSNTRLTPVNTRLWQQ